LQKTTENLEKLKALIIDDESDICFLLGSILKQRNFQPDYANSLSDAKKALEKSTPAIIFLDNHLPDGFGVDFISHIKSNYPNVKIVMITAYDTTADKTKAITTGADSFIGKPFTRDMIYQTVENLIN